MHCYERLRRTRANIDPNNIVSWGAGIPELFHGWIATVISGAPDATEDITPNIEVGTGVS